MKNNRIKKEQTEDGSNTLYVSELNEHYHSTKGALTESKHIFINEGLLHYGGNNIKILEVGFGTGLNALETLYAAEKSKKKVEYHSLELYPLSWEDVKELEYTNDKIYQTIIDSNWNEMHPLTPHFKLIKHLLDFTQLNDFKFASDFDIVYFDAFAPEKQPEMWSQQLFNRLYVLLKPGGILTTYCSKGVIRRMLEASGFHVERIPGPPNGKREILRANKI